MRKLFIFLVGLLCLTAVSALELSSEYSSNVLVYGVDNEITLDLTIENASEGNFNVYTLSDVSLKPDTFFTIDESYFEKQFTIKTTSNLYREGYYTFTYTLNDRNADEKHHQKYTINLLNIENVVEVGSDSIEYGDVKFYVQNKEDVYLKNITARFESILFDFEETFSLKPFETLEIPAIVDEEKLMKTKAGVYIIEATFLTDDGKKTVEGNLYLGEKKGITTNEDSAGLLIRSETVTKINSGNVVESVEIKMKRNIISRLFTSFNIEPTIVDRKGLFVDYTWTKEKLGPAEALTVKAKTNYVMPFLVIIVAILALLGYRRFSETKLEVKKSVSHVKTKNGEFALKIRLYLKARKSVENVTLIDKIPAIVKIYKKFGSIEPDKIDPESRRVHWHIGDLEAGEERSFSYIVYSKVGVVGKFSLPEALAVFEKEGKIHEIDSNKVFFLSDQVSGN